MSKEWYEMAMEGEEGELVSHGVADALKGEETGGLFGPSGACEPFRAQTPPQTPPSAKHTAAHAIVPITPWASVTNRRRQLREPPPFPAW